MTRDGDDDLDGADRDGDEDRDRRGARAAPEEASAALARRFDEDRARLRAVALRMLGSAGDADDAVQEAWLKIARADRSDVMNLGGFLTTVVARVCLDMLRARKARREDAARAPAGAALAPSSSAPAPMGEAEAGLVLAEAIGPALLVVLETLTPPERVAFVLHDMFDLSFDEIAPIVDRTPAAARQLASRARRRVRGDADVPDVDAARHQELVTAFLAASRDGDIARLVGVLAPDVVMRADPIAVRTAAANNWGGGPLPPVVHGAAAVADAWKGRARGATPALIDGAPGAVWRFGDSVRAAFVFTVADDKVRGVDIVMEAAALAELRVDLAL